MASFQSGGPRRRNERAGTGTLFNSSTPLVLCGVSSHDDDDLSSPLISDHEMAGDAGGPNMTS